MAEINWQALSDKELEAIGWGIRTGKRGTGSIDERIDGYVARELLRGRQVVAEGRQYEPGAMENLRYIEEG